MNPNQNEKMLDEIFSIYKPMASAGLIEYRAYYQEEKVVCFSTEKLPMAYVKIPKEIFNSNRPDLFYIEDYKIIKKTKQYQNKLQLKSNGSKFASIKSDMQWAVSLDWPHEKSYWDVNI